MPSHGPRSGRNRGSSGDPRPERDERPARTRFYAFTDLAKPGLQVARGDTPTRLHLYPVPGTEPVAGPRWVEFEYGFEPGDDEVYFTLFEFDEYEEPVGFGKDGHHRKLPRAGNSGAFAREVWFAQGAGRVVTEDPRERTADRVRIHLISQSRYRPSELYLWGAGPGRRVALANPDAPYPEMLYFDVDLGEGERSFFRFKFVGRNEKGEFAAWEPDFANRLWTAADGGQIWTHSGAGEISGTEPVRRRLRIHFRQEWNSPATMRAWQENSDYQADVKPDSESSGWATFETELYTSMSYGVHFWNTDAEKDRERKQAERRGIRISGNTERWTLEGSPALLRERPERDLSVELNVALKPPTSGLSGQLFAHVWIDQARWPIATAVPVGPGGRVTFRTYPEVVTSVKFYDEYGRWETCDRHPISVPLDVDRVARHVVLERPPLLEQAPPQDIFQDPPFLIRRPGAYEEDGHLHFVVHAPGASRLRLTGEWAGWDAAPVEMRSTRDGTYWWGRVPRQQILDGLGTGDYHGAGYRYVFNDSERLQDPAAGWVENSWSHAASRLVRSDAFQWHDQEWRRPGWEYLLVYQVHASRFSSRYRDEAPLVRVAREIADNAGYLRGLGVTAILLLPVNEVGTHNSWGYDPAYFYAVENVYGGPDALKQLVDACHQNGLAVLLDVVFNHAGSVDNILWSVARDSFFDGDTAWGSMINFDHPQCRHFFAQNLVYLAQEYHVDGFRLDHTGTIVHSSPPRDGWNHHVREFGSGGGWEFLHAIRHALHSQVDPRCILMAEHLPNEWRLTNYGGPMDTQWCDDFHDRMVDACRRDPWVIPRLADAFKLSHTACDDWYKVTNYPESHDEVGNVRDRIAYIAGPGQGLRMSKVAAAGSLLSRGIPMFFMGAESAEDRQFTFGGTSTLDLDRYLSDPEKGRVRAWWRELCWLRRNPSIQGPSPLDVRFAEGQMLAFSRGQRGDFFVLLNFGSWSGHRSLAEMNLPGGVYRELWNSSWPAFAIAAEDEHEHTNGGRDARLDRSNWLHIPDYGAVILERAD